MNQMASPCGKNLVAMFTLREAMQHMVSWVDSLGSVKVLFMMYGQVFAQCGNLGCRKITPLAPEVLVNCDQRQWALL